MWRRRGPAETGDAGDAEPVRRHGLADGARPPGVAVPSDLALRQTHGDDLESERGAPGIGFGE